MMPFLPPRVLSTKTSDRNTISCSETGASRLDVSFRMIVVLSYFIVPRVACSFWLSYSKI